MSRGLLPVALCCRRLRESPGPLGTDAVSLAPPATTALTRHRSWESGERLFGQHPPPGGWAAGSLPRPRSRGQVPAGVRRRLRGGGHRGHPYAVPRAERQRLRGTLDPLGPGGVPRPPAHRQRSAPTARARRVCRLLQCGPAAPGPRATLPGRAPCAHTGGAGASPRPSRRPAPRLFPRGGVRRSTYCGCIFRTLRELAAA